MQLTRIQGKSMDGLSNGIKYDQRLSCRGFMLLGFLRIDEGTHIKD
jgi:hypothetical protein